MNTTLLILKPDCVARGYIGEIISRLEKKGLSILAMKMIRVSRELAEQHYAEHKNKPFFEDLLRFITSRPVVPMVVEGMNAPHVCRQLIGVTDCSQAAAGTIRGDFGMSGRFNLIHGSDSPESAKREIALWFTPDEIMDTYRDDYPWLHNPDD